MTRQSISLTTPNNDWLNTQVASEEFKSKSELVNDLIRKARIHQEEIEYIRAKLIYAENSGFVNQNKDEILADIKKDLVIENDL